MPTAEIRRKPAILLDPTSYRVHISPTVFSRCFVDGGYEWSKEQKPPVTLKPIGLTKGILDPVAINDCHVLWALQVFCIPAGTARTRG